MEDRLRSLLGRVMAGRGEPSLHEEFGALRAWLAQGRRARLDDLIELLDGAYRKAPQRYVAEWYPYLASHRPPLGLGVRGHEFHSRARLLPPNGRVFAHIVRVDARDLRRLSGSTRLDRLWGIIFEGPILCTEAELEGFFDALPREVLMRLHIMEREPMAGVVLRRVQESASAQPGEVEAEGAGEVR